MSSLRTQTLWSMMPILVTSVVSIVSVPLYFRFLGEEKYALWIFIATLTGAFGFMDLGMGVATGRFMGVALGKNDQEAVKEYWATGNAIVFPMVLFFALGFIIAGTIWGPTWFSVAADDLSMMRWAIFWGGCGLFFSYYGQMWFVLAQTHLDFKFLSLMRTATSLITALGTVAVALWTQNVATIIFFGSAIGLIQFGILWNRGIHHYKLRFRRDLFKKSRLYEMLPYTSKTFAMLISGSLLGSLDRLFLARLAPAIDFASFGVSQNVGGRLTGLSVAVMGPIFHNTTRGVGGDVSRSPALIYKESFRLLFPWFSLAIIGVFFWSGPVTDVWLGDQYGEPVAQVFPWVVAGLCINAMANISGAQLGGIDRVGTGLVISVMANVASAAGVVIGWYLQGITGAAQGFFAARCLWILQDYLVRRWVGVSWRFYLENMVITGIQIGIVGSIFSLASLISEKSIFLDISFAAFSAVAGSVIILIFAHLVGNKHSMK
jgi:O-antigen/teichoic acid export membrane protein